MDDIKYLKLFSNIYKIFLIILTVIMFVIIGINVFSRFVLNNSLGWADELSRFIFLWISFLGAVLAYATDEHVGLNFLVNKISSLKFKNLIKVIADFLVLLVVLFLTYFGYVVASSATNVSPALYIPMSFVYSIVPVSGIMLCILNITKICVHTKLLIKNKDKKNSDLAAIGGVK